MQVNSSQSIRRKSFRNHQQIRRHCTAPIICASAIPILIILGLYCALSPSPLPEAAPEIHSNIAQAAISAQEAYLQTYCRQPSECQQQNIEALTAILTLIEHTSSPPQHPHQQEALFEPAPALQQVKREEEPEEESQSSANGLQIGPGQRGGQRLGKSKLSQVPLQVIKHSKVTSPAKLSLLQQLSSIFIRADPYPNIDRIVEGGNWFVWRPNTATVSIGVRTTKSIRPTTVEVILERAGSEWLELVGLSITLEQKAILTSLGEYEVREGVNRINCDRVECGDYYDSVIFRLGSVDVSSIKVFEAVEVELGTNA